MKKFILTILSLFVMQNICFAKDIIEFDFPNDGWHKVQSPDKVASKHCYVPYNQTEENFTETNEIIFPSPDEPAKYLKLTSSEPAVLQIKRTLSKENERVLEYTETYKHWQYYKFEISSSD